MDSVKIGIGVSSIGRFLPYIGKAAGFFAAKDIAVEVVNQQDEEKIVADIAAHKTPVGTPNAPSLIFALLDNEDLTIVGGVLNRPAFFLVANETVGRIGDLKGKRIGINQPRRMAGMVMLALLRRWNFGPDDLDLIDLGLNDRSLEALRAGQIDAALLPPEKAFLAETEGYRVAADSLDLDCHWVPLATTRSFLATHRDLVQRIASVYVESIRFFTSEPQRTLAEIARQLPALAGKPQVLSKCYELFAPRFAPALAPAPASVRSILKEVSLQDPRASELNPESIIETVL